MSSDRPKKPKRTTDTKASGRKGRGHRSQATAQRRTEHRCFSCGKRDLDDRGKPPRVKYARRFDEAGAMDPQCYRWAEGLVA